MKSKCTKCKSNPKYTGSSWCNVCINERKRELRKEKRELGLEAYGEKRRKTCRKCKRKKEKNYMNDSLCKSCRSETNRDRRIMLRAKKGLPLWGSGRKKECSTCGKLKEEGRDIYSRCISCAAEAGKVGRAKKRIVMGLKPLGYGRKNECCRCGKLTEKKEDGYCRECDALCKSERRFKKVSTQEGKEEERAKYNQKLKDPDFIIKKVAREVLNRCVYAGIIKRMPCEVCGKEKAEGHHDNYLEPLNVRWLCRKHHVEHHKNEKDVKL